MYQSFNLKSKEVPLIRLSLVRLLLSTPALCAFVKICPVYIKAAEQIKHIDTNPSISLILPFSDNVNVSSGLIRKKKAIRQTDRGREGFQKQQWEDKQMDKLSIKDIKFASTCFE